uniref:cytochrome c biogenesis protein n=1 Tax=Pseudoerythrocladia kornmannii TaxID=753682 RepID=UPI001BEEBDFF|nr:cytochrome c biogenesis protein [Pseudoerythrocladia kornmannii]QUE28190.1 CcsA [Pseudoerythrocladia kornmannii]UNJ16694.1 cytochrome c biogenesis protein [Pseudoerythrocladia kornmannii]
MPNFQNSLANYTFLNLLISMFMYWISIAFPKLKIAQHIGKVGIVIANIAIAFILSFRWWNEGYFPLSNLYESLLFLSWGLTSVQLILEARIKNQIVGAVTTPVSMFIIAFASMSLPLDMQKASPLVPALKSNWLMMHVSIMIISYATLILGSLLSILFLIITKGKDVNLKGSSIGNGKMKKDLEGALKVTPTSSNAQTLIDKNNYQQITLLESIDNLSYRTIGLGFPLLTIGIIAGAVWANEAWGTYWSWDPKETWALITWLIFAAYLHTRINKAWEGKRPAILASVGFVVVWICYLGVNFLGKGLHSYGWVS